MKKIVLCLSASVLVFSASAQQRVPLLEVFTSSTCPPCKPGNTNLANVLAAHQPSEYVVIKYQQNFPGTGDPYATNETVNRRNAYSINSIPRMEVDGGWDENAQLFTESLYTAAKAVPAEYNISGSYSVSGKIVTANVNYSVLTTVPAGAKLFVAITEKETIKNKKTNGETKFEDVMKKMMPSESGTQITEITAGQSGSKSLSFTFAGDYRLPANGSTANHINDQTENSVEDFANLQVVAWIQGADKKVYQAGNLSKGVTGIKNVSNSIGEFKMYPNPANSFINLNVAMKASDKVTVNLYDLKGALVSTSTSDLLVGDRTVTVNTSNLASGMYSCVVFDSQNNSFSKMVSISH